MAESEPINGSLTIEIGSHRLPASYIGHYQVGHHDGKDMVEFIGAIHVLGNEMPCRTTLLCELPRSEDGKLHSSVTSAAIGQLIESSLIHRFTGAEPGS
ncbi:hypothetical protein ACO2Q9_09765 [Variovorax sp. VNK109]|uniref:hypothetical protein n=1 Tax=Variovorax sp. VNK109 TaxID=3400919 RepID=UPI003C0BEFC4